MRSLTTRSRRTRDARQPGIYDALSQPAPEGWVAVDLDDLPGEFLRRAADGHLLAIGVAELSRRQLGHDGGDSMANRFAQLERDARRELVRHDEDAMPI